MGKMTDLSGHTQGNRPTRIMSTGWDGNLGLNMDGGKNVRSAESISFGEEGEADHSCAASPYFDAD